MTIYDSDYEVRLAELGILGGDTTKQYDSVYEIDLAILDKIQGGGISQQVINDNSISLNTTFSSQKITQLVADAGFNVEFVNELPASGDIHTIYFVPSTNPKSENEKDEFMWNASQSKWEQVGSTTVDLTDILDDSLVSSEKTWSSEKINAELEALAGDANSDIVAAETVDVTFVNAVPVEAGEDGQYVIYVTESADTLYQYNNGSWVSQTPDANKLYFDTEHDQLYSYVSATHKFMPVAVDNTIIFSGSITSNAAKTALNPIKTPGVYNVLQHQTSAGKTKMTNWSMTVTYLDSDEADEVDGSVYQKLQNNYTIYKRYYKPKTDTWTTMSKYYEGLVRDSLTSSAYYSWSVNKIKSELAVKADAADLNSYATIAYVTSELAGKADVADLSSYATIAYVTNELAGKADVADLSSYATIAYVTNELAGKQCALTEGANIEIVNNTISAYGFVFDKSKGSIAEQYFDDDNNVIATNTATGIGTHAEGYATTASGDYGAHAEGYLTKATYTSEGGYNHGVGAHAEGWSTEAKHDGAHAEGVYTLASAQGAHAEGSGAQNELVQALGMASHAEGAKTIARNLGEHAEGFKNISHTTGSQTLDNGGNTAHSVGVGTNNLRRNAEEIMYNGDMYVFGVGNYDGIHIKGEQGAPENTATLQEVIAGKADVYEVATPADIKDLFFFVQSNEIYYTSSQNEVITPTSTKGLPTIVSNTNVDGKGMIEFASDVTKIPREAFAWNDTLTSMQIPDSVTSIDGTAWDGCENLTSPIYNAYIFAKMPTSYSGTYAIPNGIETVTDYAFMNCSGLTSVTIPNSVTSIGDSAFEGCSGLPVTDNVRYADTCAVGMGTRGLTNYTVKPGTRFIHSLAFSGSYGGDKMTSITLPDTIEQIGRSAFYWCPKLTSITLPASLTDIGDSCFFHCGVLTNISFTGTIAQWNTITKGGDWNLAVPATVVHCSDGDVNL